MAQAMAFFDVPVISPLTTRDLKMANTSFNTIPSRKTLSKRISAYIDSLDAAIENPCVMIIADDKKIEMPIMNAIYNILYNQYNIKDVINNLLERPIKDEIK